MYSCVIFADEISTISKWTNAKKCPDGTRLVLLKHYAVILTRTPAAIFIGMGCNTLSLLSLCIQLSASGTASSGFWSKQFTALLNVTLLDSTSWGWFKGLNSTSPHPPASSSDEGRSSVPWRKTHRQLLNLAYQCLIWLYQTPGPCLSRALSRIQNDFLWSWYQLPVAH